MREESIVNYKTSNKTIANPERGLQKYSITAKNYSTNNKANNLSVSTLNDWKNSPEKITVVYRLFVLDAFTNSNINSTYLNNIIGDFNNVRTAGLKIIVRFAYSNSQGKNLQQPSKSQILIHISQLSAVLNKNRDVIFSHQAGFIGTWGEWYYTNSEEFGTEDSISENQWLNRKEILDAMLEATPVEIPIQVRYVKIKTKLYGTTPLTEQTAYQNTKNSRIGFYNDAFLNNWGDNGTYSVDSKCENPVNTPEYNYLSNETQYLPMTGETNGLNKCNPSRTISQNAIHEMRLTNWTTLNRDYYPSFWEQIIKSNSYDEILRNLGYRFILNSSTVVINGKNFHLTLNVKNVGYARLFKSKDVYLIVKNIETNENIKYLVNTDVRKWDTSNEIIKQNFNLEKNGTFQLYLSITDKEPILRFNPNYSIQFANLDIWEQKTGYNNLLQTIKI